VCGLVDGGAVCGESRNESFSLPSKPDLFKINKTKQNKNKHTLTDVAKQACCPASLLG